MPIWLIHPPTARLDFRKRPWRMRYQICASWPVQSVNPIIVHWLPWEKKAKVHT